MGKKRRNNEEKRTLLERIINWTSIGLFVLLPLLYFPGRIASYVTSKQYFFTGIVDVLLVLWVWLMLIDGRYRLSRKNMMWLSPLAIFLLSMTVSAFVGIDSATSFFSTVETGTGLLLLYHAFFFACIVASFVRVRQKQFVTTIFQATLFASAVLSGTIFFTGRSGIVDIGSKMLNGSSGGAMMGNSSLAGAYVLFGFFFAILLIREERVLWKKVLYWVAVVVIVFSPLYFNVDIWKGVRPTSLYLLIGQARFAAISLIGGVLVSVSLWLCMKSHKKAQIAGIGAIATLCIIGAVLLQQVATPHTSLNTFFIQQSGNRTVDWSAAMQGIKERPLLGWGPENFHVVYQKHLDPVVFSIDRGNEVWALHPHNDFLEILINGGLIGGVLYLGFILALFISLLKLRRDKRIDTKTCAILFGTLVAFVVQQQLVYESITSYVMLFSVIGMTAGLMDASGKFPQARIHDPAERTIIGIGIVLIFLPAWIYGAYLPSRKMEELQRIANTPSDKRAALYNHVFHSAGSYAINTDAEFFADPLYSSYDAQKEQIRDNPVYKNIASEEVDTLIKELHPVWLQHPYSYHLTLSLLQLENLLFYLTNDTQYLQQADIYAQKALELSPTDPQIYTMYSQTLLYENNIAGAKKLLDTSIRLNENYRPAGILRRSLP